MSVYVIRDVVRKGVWRPLSLFHSIQSQLRRHVIFHGFFGINIVKSDCVYFLMKIKLDDLFTKRKRFFFHSVKYHSANGMYWRLSLYLVGKFNLLLVSRQGAREPACSLRGENVHFKTVGKIVSFATHPSPSR